MWRNVHFSNKIFIFWSPECDPGIVSGSPTRSQHILGVLPLSNVTRKCLRLTSSCQSIARLEVVSVHCCEGAIERPPPCEMVQVASVFDQFCDLRLALSSSMARCSFQAFFDAHHLILSFVTRMFCWRAATLTALFGAPYSPELHCSHAGSQWKNYLHFF